MRNQSNRPLRLSRRERQVAELLAEGHTDKGIAELLGIGVTAVHQYVSHLYWKMGIERWSGMNPRVLLARKLWELMRSNELEASDDREVTRKT